MALQTAAISGAGIEEAAVRALTTVRQVMPSRLRHRLDALTFTAIPRVTRGGDSAASPETLIALSTAIRAREILRFDYASGRPPARDAEPPAPRRIEPHHIVTSNGRWYLVAWDLDHDDWRVFRVDRITPRTPTGPRFTPRDIPGGDVRAFVSARFKGSDQANSWPCVGTVILGLPAHAVIPFTGDGIVTELGPDRCSLESGSWSWMALAASFGRFDADIEVVGPPELATAFEQLSARYGAASMREA